MGKGLPGIQAGAVAAGRPVHERVGLQVHRIQWRPSPLPWQRLCLLSDEIRRRLYNLPLSCQGGEGSSG